MKGYILVVDKYSEGTSHSPEVKSVFSKFYNKEVKVDETLRGRYSFCTFTNEEFPEGGTQVGNYILGMSGYTTVEEDSSLLEGLVSAKNKDAFVTKIGGVFTLALFNKSTCSLNVWNNVTRVEPVYWCETESRVVVGTKALLVNLFAQRTESPVYDYNNFTSFLNNGFFCDEKTPFKDVQVLEPNSKITVENLRVKVSPIDDFFDSVYRVDPDNDFYDRITNDFLESFEVLKRHDLVYKMGLTGGKDSRLVAAAMSKIGLEAEVHTNGFNETPDVIVAKLLAEKLGFKHNVRPTSTSNKNHYNVDIFNRTVDAIRNTEGMLSSYENVSGSLRTFNYNKVDIGGQGGELLRGGYAKNVNITSDAQLIHFLKTRFNKYSELLKEDPLTNYNEFLINYVGKVSTEDPTDTLNRFYLEYRCGRWSGSSRSSYTSSHHSYAPFFDAKVVRNASVLKTKYGADEELIYNMLVRIAPELVEVPFADDRWAFEKNHPYSKYKTDQWEYKKPVTSLSKIGSFNWRKNVLGNMNEEFYRVIFANDNSPLFEIVDKTALENLFSSERTNLNKYDDFLWNAYTASVLFSNEWLSPPKIPHEIRIELPDTQDVSLDVKEFKLIKPKHLTEVGQKVKVKSYSPEVAQISWKEATRNDKLYFQVFDNSFSSPASIKYEDLPSLEKGKNYNVQFEIEKVDVGYFEIELYIMQFNGANKIKQESKVFKLWDKKEIHNLGFIRNEETSSFKLAFKIKNSLNSGSFMLNQLILS